MKRIAVSLLLCFKANLLVASPAEVIAKAHSNASDQPKSQQFFNAAMVFDWEPNRIYQIYTKPGRITDISLEPQENIISVAGGDSQRWTISDSASGKDAGLTKHILVKPHQLGISNNLVVTTDKRVYHIELHSLEQIPYQAAVSWSYPRSSLLVTSDYAHSKNKNPMSGLAQAQLNFNYHFVAKDRPNWMPRRVFDDGHKTYIEFPQSMQDSEAPVLWGLSKAKEQELINYRRHKNFYIIDHLIDLAELTVGGKSSITVGIERDSV